MSIVHNLTTRAWLLGLLLHAYIGGFAFFWGASTGDAYLVIVFAFLMTQLVSRPITLNLILQKAVREKIPGRYLRLFMNFAVNVLLANLLMSLMHSIHPGDMARFLAGPILYGLLYGVLYYLYFLLNLREQGLGKH